MPETATQQPSKMSTLKQLEPFVQQVRRDILRMVMKIISLNWVKQHLGSVFVKIYG